MTVCAPFLRDTVTMQSYAMPVQDATLCFAEASGILQQESVENKSPRT